MSTPRATLVLACALLSLTACRARSSSRKTVNRTSQLRAAKRRPASDDPAFMTTGRRPPNGPGSPRGPLRGGDEDVEPI